MSSKSLNVKTFINDAGVHNQLFVFAGSNDSASLSNSTQTSTELWNYSDFSVRVGQNSLSAVIPYVKWVQSKPYKSWSSSEPNTGNFYAYNDQNGYVYLCISDNQNNRTDHSGNNVSTYRPVHTSGIQTYDDGYSWKPMYRITSSIERFVTSSWLPVISFDNFNNESQKTQLELAQTFCSEYSTLEVGQCAIYAKQSLNTDDDLGTNEYEAGSLFAIADNVTCRDCYYMMFDNTKFISVFYGSTETVPTTYTVYDVYQYVGTLIQNGELTQSSPYYYLYTINESDNIQEGSVISVFIDLSEFTTTQLQITVENPELTVTSNTGSGARIRLKTKILNNKYVIDGIELLDPGQGYKDITISIDASYLAMDLAMLKSAISINLDTIDGLGFDPVDALGCQHVMIDARLEKKLIEDSGILVPTKLNFFGLIQNPTSTVGTNNITSASDKNKKIDIVYRTTLKTQLQTPVGVSIAPGEELTIEDTVLPGTNLLTSNIVIGGVETVSATAANVEMKNLLYDKADYLVGKTLEYSSSGTPVNATITSVIAEPEFVQYTGKILSTTKLNNDLQLSDTDSVIIRINMIKGM